MKPNHEYDFAIVGAGVYGLSVAYYLSKTGAKILILERYTIGHNHGSSHGSTRISRSIYKDKFYSDLNQISSEQYWPQMEKDLGVKLMYPAEFLYFDDLPGSYVEYYKAAKDQFGTKCFLNPKQVAEKFPNFPFIKSPHNAIVDFNAGVVSAIDTVNGLLGYLRKQPNVDILQKSTVQSLKEDQQKVSISLKFTSQKFIAKKAVVSAGRWLNEVLPQLKGLTKVIKQYVGYLELENMSDYEVGKFPTFCHNDKIDREYFFVPDFKQDGLKIGMHNTKNQGFSAEKFEEKIREKAVQIFGNKFRGIKKIQECYYTVTRSEDFIIDWVNPQNQRILVSSCCSGHGFKFVAVLGKIISDILQQKETLALFEKKRFSFSIPYHQGVHLQ